MLLDVRLEALRDIPGPRLFPLFLFQLACQGPASFPEGFHLFLVARRLRGDGGLFFREPLEGRLEAFHLFAQVLYLEKAALHVLLFTLEVDLQLPDDVVGEGELALLCLELLPDRRSISFLLEYLFLEVCLPLADLCHALDELRVPVEEELSVYLVQSVGQFLVRLPSLPFLLRLAERSGDLPVYVVDAFQVRRRLFHAVHGVPFLLLEPRYPACLFDDDAPLGGFHADQGLDASLLDDGVGIRAKARSQEGVLHVLQSDDLAVEGIFVRAVPVYPSLYDELPVPSVRSRVTSAMLTGLFPLLP